MLMNRWKNHCSGYVDHSNIKEGFLVQDGLHLNEIGKRSLANNFINVVNKYIFWYEKACNDSDTCLSNAAQEHCTYPKKTIL